MPAAWKRLFGDGKSKSSAGSGGICPTCKSNPVALNPATGKYFDYCSRSCAPKMPHPGANQSGSSIPALCEQCKMKPKFKDGTKVHPYCGRTCSLLAASNQAANNLTASNLAASNSTASNNSTPASPVSPHSLRSAQSTISRTTSSGPNCQTPGCLSPVFVDGNGVPSKYCKRTHKQWGERGCISCRAAPRNGRLVMCQLCHDKTLRVAPVLVEVPGDHENYKSVETQFKQTWRHGTTCPEVRAVYKIIGTTASLNKYEKYLNSVEANRDFASMGKSRGNENRRWHGTRRKCNLGDKGVTNFCTDSKCSLCCIIKTSFDLRFFKGATGWGRFGAGIYTSSTSSKSNDYSANDCVSNWKALLLNKVVVGKGLKLVLDDPTLTGPPAGFDSVLAEVVPGGAVNYDELVVYNNDAARPSYLVMYDSP